MNSVEFRLLFKIRILSEIETAGAELFYQEDPALSLFALALKKIGIE
jgi:hypothetical protein